MESRSPLKYLGKSKIAQHIVKEFPSDIKVLVSPFLGGGSLELMMADRDVEVFAYDADPLLINFWKVWKAEPIRLAQEIKKRMVWDHVITKDEKIKDGWCVPVDLYEEYREWNQKLEPFEMAVRFWLVNRGNRFGTQFNSYFKQPYKTELIFERIAAGCPNNLHVQQQDVETTLRSHNGDGSFVYVDPPYTGLKDIIDGDGALWKGHVAYYGKSRELSRDFERLHNDLKNHLTNLSNNWMMSNYHHCDTYEIYDHEDFQIERKQYGTIKVETGESHELVIRPKEQGKDMGQLHKSGQKQCPKWIMDHIIRVVPDIEWKKDIDGVWPQKCFVLPRLDNEEIADWIEEIPLSSSEIVVMLLPNWTNQYWFGWVEHMCDKFYLKGEVKFEGEDIAFPGGLVLAIFGNTAALTDYLLSLPRNPKALGKKPQQIALDASFSSFRTTTYIEQSSIQAIATPVKNLIETDRRRYSDNYKADSFLYQRLEHQEHRLKEKIWEKRNPELAAIKRFEAKIENIRSNIQIDEEEVSDLLSSDNDNDLDLCREIAEWSLEGHQNLLTDMKSVSSAISNEKRKWSKKIRTTHTRKS